MAKEKMTHGAMWIRLGVARAELCVNATLQNGQCFGWRRIDDFWRGVISDEVIDLKTDSADTSFRRITPRDSRTSAEVASWLRDYFQLSTPLSPLYKIWAAADARFSGLATCVPGMRVIRQEPLECLVSFISSSNNNIPRIKKMIESLRQTYGASIGAEEFAFPTLDQLKQADEDSLRRLGFG